MFEMMLMGGGRKVISQWGQLPKLLSPTFAASTVYHEGNIYSFGGYAANGTTNTDTVTKYNIATDVTTTLLPLPAPRVSIPVAKVNNKIYICCGSGYGQAPNDMYEFDTITEEWTRLADPIKEPGNGYLTSPSFANADGILYLMGSINQNGIHQKYDPVTNTWTRLQNAPVANMHGGTYVNLGNSNYYIAGNPSSQTVYQYDILLDIWTKLPDLSMPSGYGYASCVINNTAYVVAAASNGNPWVVLSYDGTNWSKLTDNKAPGYGDGISLTTDGISLYISGGQTIISSVRKVSDQRVIFTPANI